MTSLLDCTSKEKAHVDFLHVVEVPHVRCQRLRRECGSVRIGSVVYEPLAQCLEASDILSLILLRVNKMRNFHRRFNLRQRTASEGMNTFLGYEGVPWPLRPCLHRGVEALGTWRRASRPTSFLQGLEAMTRPSRALPCTAWRRAAPAGPPRRAGRHASARGAAGPAAGEAGPASGVAQKGF